MKGGGRGTNAIQRGKKRGKISHNLFRGTVRRETIIRGKEGEGKAREVP